MRTLDEAEKLRLAKLSIFDKINKGDWYQYSKEVELQKIVKNSSQKISEINDKAKENIDEARKLLEDFLPNLPQSRTCKIVFLTVVSRCISLNCIFWSFNKSCPTMTTNNTWPTFFVPFHFLDRSFTT